MPFDGIVRKLVDERIAVAPAGKTTLKSSELAEKIFHKLREIEPGNYAKIEDDSTRKALEHLQLYDEFNRAWGIGSWRDYTWAQLSKTVSKSAAQSRKGKYTFIFALWFHTQWKDTDTMRVAKDL